MKKFIWLKFIQSDKPKKHLDEKDYQFLDKISNRQQYKDEFSNKFIPNLGRNYDEENSAYDDLD